MSALTPTAQATAADLASQAVPLAGKAAPDAAAPLPPAGLLDALDNSGSAAAPAASAEEERVTLDFVGDDLPEQTFPLRYPFRWEGAVVSSVTVRQLTTGQVARIVGEISRKGSNPELMDIYAAMSGLPAKVLSAMPSIDTDPIIEKAFDFLPPLFRPASG